MDTVHIISPSRYVVDRTRLKKAVHNFMVKKDVDLNKCINVVFVGKTKMKFIADTYKNEPVALPVLSFSYKDDSEKTFNLLGEIIICYPQAVLLAAERHKKVDTMIEELVIHGLQNICTI